MCSFVGRKKSKNYNQSKRPWIIKCILMAVLLIFCFFHLFKDKINKTKKFVSNPLFVASSNILKTNDFDNPKLRKAVHRIVSEQSIVISGMVKDGEPDLMGLLLQIEKFSCHFDDFLIVILSNNNKDNTTHLLNVWAKRPIHCDYKNTKLAKKGKKFETKKHILSFSNNEDPAPPNLSREDRFVFYRNCLIDFVIGRGIVFDHWAMIDFDVQSIETHRIFNEFCIASQLLGVDVFCVNGMEWTGRYRDSFATIFNDGQWCYDDGGLCSETIQKHRFTQVRSCFGGLSIYKFASIQQSKCRYDTKNNLKKVTNEWLNEQRNNKNICEHIAFHDCLYSHYNNDLIVAISRDSHLFYGFAEYTEWDKEHPHFSPPV